VVVELGELTLSVAMLDVVEGMVAETDESEMEAEPEAETELLSDAVLEPDREPEPLTVDASEAGADTEADTPPEVDTSPLTEALGTDEGMADEMSLAADEAELKTSETVEDKESIGAELSEAVEAGAD